jgi:DNA-binding transcriptional MerR regulator
MPVLFKIGELALQANVGVATIRYYESLRLIEPVKKASSGYRYYDQAAIKRVKFIKQAQSLQFSLTDIRQVLQMRQQGQPTCSLVKDLLDRKINALENNIHQATLLKAELEIYRTNWQTRPIDNLAEVEVCSLIEEVTIGS